MDDLSDDGEFLQAVTEIEMMMNLTESEEVNSCPCGRINHDLIICCAGDDGIVGEKCNNWIHEECMPLSNVKLNSWFCWKHNKNKGYYDYNYRIFLV